MVISFKEKQRNSRRKDGFADSNLLFSETYNKVSLVKCLSFLGLNLNAKIYRDMPPKEKDKLTMYHLDINNWVKKKPCQNKKTVKRLKLVKIHYVYFLSFLQYSLNALHFHSCPKS